MTIQVQGGLEGLKVADFGWVIAGPMTTRFLGYHGATVVRVESAVRMDVFRNYVPMAHGIYGINRCATFDAFNNDKFSMRLNLNTPQGRAIAERLVDWADVVIENFSPGAMDKWGLSYDHLIKRRPDLIMVSLSMLGQTGPYAKQPGFGTMLQSLSGFTSLAGWPDRAPAGLSLPYTDYVVPWLTIAALMAALDHRERTGRGQYIESSQLEAGAGILAHFVLDAVANGRGPTPLGNRAVDAAPHGVYPCQGEERWCAIAVHDDRQWQAFCAAIGQPAIADDERFDTLLARKRNEDALDAIVSEWTARRSPEEVMAALQSVGVPAGVVADGHDLYNDAHLQYRHHFQQADHPEIGPHSYEAPAWRLSETPGAVRRPTPCFGEHTEYVCRDLLAMSDDEYQSLLAAGIFY